MKNACTCSNYSGWLVAMRAALLAQGVCGGTFWPLLLSLRAVPGVEGSLSPCAVLIDALAPARARGGVAGATPCSSCVHSGGGRSRVCVLERCKSFASLQKQKRGTRREEAALIDWRIAGLVWNSNQLLVVLCALEFFQRIILDVRCQRRWPCCKIDVFSARVCVEKMLGRRVKDNWVRALLPFVYMFMLFPPTRLAIILATLFCSVDSTVKTNADCCWMKMVTDERKSS